LLFSNDESEKFYVKTHLMSKFEMKDFGEAKNILEIRLRREEGKLFLDQKKYINDVLIRFNMTECKSVGTPYVVGATLERANECDDCPYQEIVGSLMYLSVWTRPDIAYTVSHLSSFNHYHGKEHWIAGKRVLRYLNFRILLSLSED
jgi:hypothetical protein